MKNKKMYASIVSTVVRRLKQAGLRPDAIEKAKTALASKLEPFRLSRRAAARVSRMVDRDGVAVVTRGKVYSMAGYRSKVESGRSLGSALKRADKVAKRAGRAQRKSGAKPKTLHWTQKPEHRQKVLELNKKMRTGHLAARVNWAAKKAAERAQQAAAQTTAG